MDMMFKTFVIDSLRFGASRDIYDGMECESSVYMSASGGKCCSWWEVSFVVVYS